MRLLNGYYIGEDASCTYCSGSNQSTCSNECTVESLTSANMKPLTSVAKNMIGNAVWDTYGVKYPDSGSTVASWAPTAYLQEKGISSQYTGSSECVISGVDHCNDSVERTTNWTGLLGLMSVADMTYADGWLYGCAESSLYPWSISPHAVFDYAYDAWSSLGNQASGDFFNEYVVFPSIYLKTDIQIIDGNGGDEPYKLAIN